MTIEDFKEKLTAEQQAALIELYRGMATKVSWTLFLMDCYAPTKLSNYVGVPNYHGMFVGIEEDGYTHS